MSLNEFMSLPALAKAMGVSRATVTAWRDDKGMPTIRLGSLCYVHEPAVSAWLKSRERTTAEVPGAPASSETGRS